MLLFYLILVLFAVLSVMAFLFFRRALYRPGTVDPADEASMQASRWFAYSPIVTPGAKWLREQDWKEEKITAGDGAALPGYWHGGAPEKPVLLLLHDYGSSPWIDFCLHARWAIRQGWSVLLPVERAHGESGGNWCTLGIKEGEDCLRWAELASELAGPDGRLILGGMGLGAAAVLRALDRGLPDNVKALVLDSPFFSPKRQIRYMVRDRLRMRGFPLLLMLSAYACLFWGRFPGSLDGAEALKKNERIPVFFAHGKKDGMIPYAATEQAFRDTPAPKALFTGEEAGHGDCAFCEGERYFTALEDFFRQHLGERFPLREKTKNRAKRS